MAGEEERRRESYLTHAALERTQDEAEQTRAVSQQVEDAIRDEQRRRSFSQHADLEAGGLSEEQSRECISGDVGAATNKSSMQSLGFLDSKHISEGDVLALEMTLDPMVIRRYLNNTEESIDHADDVFARELERIFCRRYSSSAKRAVAVDFYLYLYAYVPPSSDVDDHLNIRR